MKGDVFAIVKKELESWNIQYVSADSGVHQSTLYFWLDGTTMKPRLDTVLRVAKTIGLEVTVKKIVKLRAVA